MAHRSPLVASAVPVVSSALALAPASAAGSAQDWSPAALAAQAERVAEVCESPAVHDWLARAAELPEAGAVTLHVGPRTPGGFGRVVLTDAEYRDAGEDRRAGLRPLELGPERYYATFYGTPIAYAPALQHVAARLAERGVASFEGMAVLDFGYGQLGQLEMLARCGAEVHGVEIDPVVHTLYDASGAARAIETDDGRTGSIALHLGDWFADEDFRERVGAGVDDGFDLIILRNVLKKGYVTPDEPMPGYDPIDVGGSPERGAAILAGALAPGGIAIVYNLGGGHWVRDDGTYHNPADIRDPFGREAWESAGLEVVEHEADGSALLRLAGVGLGWATDVGDLGAYNVLYTLVRKPSVPTD